MKFVPLALKDQLIFSLCRFYSGNHIVKFHGCSILIISRRYDLITSLLAIKAFLDPLSQYSISLRYSSRIVDEPTEPRFPVVI